MGHVARQTKAVASLQLAHLVAHSEAVVPAHDMHTGIKGMGVGVQDHIGGPLPHQHFIKALIQGLGGEAFEGGRGHGWALVGWKKQEIAGEWGGSGLVPVLDRCHIAGHTFGHGGGVQRAGQNLGLVVVVLDVQESKHRISLSMKQAKENPWEAFESSHNKGDMINVTVKSITDFGLFVGLPGGIDGLIHLADISWEKQSADQVVSTYSKGQELDVVILNIDAEKERISLGIKQLTSDNFSQYATANSKGSIVKGMIQGYALFVHK